MGQNSAVILSIILLVVIIAAVVFGAFMLGIFPSGSTTTTQTSQTGCSPNGCARKLPIRFTFNNLYTTRPITDSITATIYRGTVQVDSNTFLGGSWDTTKADFQSGDAYSMFVTSGNSKYEFAFQVPLAQNLTQTHFQLSLNMALIGTYTISVLAPDGVTPITSSYNSTSGICNGNTPCKAAKQPAFTVVLTNSVDNSGITGTFQRAEIIENNVPRKLVANALVVTVSGQNGASAKLHITTPIITLPDHATDKHRKSDGSLDENAKGTYTTTLTLDTSGMALGDVGTVTVTYWAFLDTAYYNANGAVNSEAVALANIQFLVSA